MPSLKPFGAELGNCHQEAIESLQFVIGVE